MSKNKISKYIDSLQQNGRYTFTRNEIDSNFCKSKESTQRTLGRLVKKHRIVSPKRGFYVIVPLEYQIAGSPPVSWFIHDLMKYIGCPYYVGILTAASFYGAAHQQVQEFQVVTDRPIRLINIGRTRIRFAKKNSIHKTLVTDIKTETGMIKVSTPEYTAVDLVRYIDLAGGLSNVATVLYELSESMNPEKLAKLIETEENSCLQRLGYLLDLVECEEYSKLLHRDLTTKNLYPVLLKPGKINNTIDRNSKWLVTINEEIEADI